MRIDSIYNMVEKVQKNGECESIIHLTHVIMWVGGYSDWTPAELREWDRDIEKLEAERDERELAAKTENVDKMDTRPWDLDLATEKLYQDIINKNVTEKTTKIILQCYPCTYLDEPCKVEFLPGTCIKEVWQKLKRTIETEIDKKLSHDAVLEGSFYTK